MPENEFFIWEEKNLIEPQTNCESKNKYVIDVITSDTKNQSTPLECKNTMRTKVGGIYKIVNRIDGKYYVGSTNCFARRRKDHFRALKKNNHCNIKLQTAYNKYGHDVFQYVIEKELCYTDVNELLKLEQTYLDECKNDPTGNYNLSYDAFAPWRGKRLSESHRLNVSLGLKGKPKSSEHNRKVGLANQIGRAHV